MSDSTCQNLEGHKERRNGSTQDGAYSSLQSEVNSLRRDNQGSSQSANDWQSVEDHLHKLGVLPSLHLVSDNVSAHDPKADKDEHPCSGGPEDEGRHGEDDAPGGHDHGFRREHRPPDGTDDDDKLPKGSERDYGQEEFERPHRGGHDHDGANPPENPITNPTLNPPENPIINPPSNPPEVPPVLEPPTQSPTGQFSVTNGEIIGPDGKRFIPKGIAVGGNSALANESTILKDFPGINAIRYTATPTGEYYWNSSSTPTAKSPSIAQTEQFINDMTKRGIVTEIDCMDSEPNQIISQSAMDAQKKWIGQIAADEKNNPYVWFQTPNEPNNKKNSNQSVVDEQVNYYNAVRGAGNNNLVTLEETQSGTLAPMLADKAAYANMSNVAFDLHAYNFTADKVSAKITATEAITSKDGKIPVLFGEYGDTYPNGTIMSPDVNGSLKAVQNSGEGGLAWSFRNMGGTSEINQLTNADGSLTNYGKEVAAYIAE